MYIFIYVKLCTVVNEVLCFKSNRKVCMFKIVLKLIGTDAYIQNPNCCGMTHYL